MIQYQDVKVMQDKLKGKIVVEYDSNTFEFSDCTMAEVSEFMTRIWEEE